MSSEAIESEGRRAVFNRAIFNREVHGARGLFAGAVFLFHVINSGLPTWPLLRSHPLDFLLRTTEYGVELFFCISGFVIVGTLRRALHPAAFMEDRLIRIYPVLWATIFVVVGLGLAGGVRGIDVIPAQSMAWLLAANLLALPGMLPLTNFHPAAWSLSYELAFYGLCALGWALRRRIGLATALMLTIPVGGLMMALHPRAIPFACGVFVAVGLAKWRPVAAMARHPLPFLIAFLVLWREIQQLSSPLHITQTSFVEWMGDWRAPLAVFAVIAATIGFAGIVAGHGVLGAILRSRPLQFLGTVSYSFYLWHPIIMSIVKQAMLRGGLVPEVGQAAQGVFLVLSLPPALLVAWASQLVLERGTGKWLRRQLHHRPPLRPAAFANPSSPPVAEW